MKVGLADDDEIRKAGQEADSLIRLTIHDAPFKGRHAHFFRLLLEFLYEGPCTIMQKAEMGSDDRIFLVDMSLLEGQGRYTDHGGTDEKGVFGDSHLACDADAFFRMRFPVQMYQNCFV